MKKLWLILFALIFITTVSALEPYEWFNETEGGINFGDNYWESQTFTVGTVGSNVNFLANYTIFNLTKTGSPTGTATVSIRAVNATGAPTGPDLVTGLITLTGVEADYGLYQVNFTSEYTLSAGTSYALVINNSQNSGANLLTWASKNSGSYTGGSQYESQNSGSTWDIPAGARDLYFEIWGDSQTESTLSIALSTPEDGASISDAGTNFVVNYTATNSELTNTTYYVWYNNGSVFNSTESMNLNGTTNTSTMYIDDFQLETYLWNVYACITNSTGFFCDWGTENYTLISGLNIINISQNNETTEGNLETFEIVTNYTVDVTDDVQANLVYNGTSYSASKNLVGGTAYFSRQINIPQVDSSQNISFYWEIILVADDVYNYFNSSTYNQSVINIRMDSCDSYSNKLFNFTLLDEITQLEYSGVAYDENSTIEFDIDIYPQGSSTPVIEYYNSTSNSSSASVCLESDLGSSTYEVYAEVIYYGDTHAKEYYYIQNLTVNGNNTPRNVTLYDLDSTNSQEFKITYKDENFLAVENALIQIQRKYTSEGVFKTVEVPKTDANGETKAHLQLEGAVYTIVVTKFGETLATFDNVVPICQTPTLSTCEINLNSFASSVGPTDYTVGDDFTFTLDYDEDTREVEAVYTIPSGSSSTVLLNVTLFDNIGATEACSDSLISASGTLTCTVPISLGNGTVIATITKDGEFMGRGVISLEQKPSDIYGANLVFLGIILMVFIIGAGINDNPMITGFFLLIGAVVLIGFSIINTGASRFIGAGATVLWLFIAVIIILIKGAKRQ